MTTAERLAKIDESVEKTKALNAELEATLNGGDTGYKSYYHEFWDALQKNGNRAEYAYAFSSWDCEYIHPKYKVVPTGLAGTQYMFRSNGSLKKVESQYFDLSQVPYGTGSTHGLYCLFYGCTKLEEVEDIGLSPSFIYYMTFYNCLKLHTIAKITVDENTQFTRAFENCNELVNLIVGGTIGKNGFDIHWSTKLSKSSITNIINALSTTTSGLTVTLSKTAVNNAFTTDEWNTLIATKSNWTISLA